MENLELIEVKTLRNSSKIRVNRYSITLNGNCLKSINLNVDSYVKFFINKEKTRFYITKADESGAKLTKRKIGVTVSNSFLLKKLGIKESNWSVITSVIQSDGIDYICADLSNIILGKSK